MSGRRGRSANAVSRAIDGADSPAAAPGARREGTTSAGASVTRVVPRGLEGRRGGTAIQRCVRDELRRHLELLDGEPPSDLYRLVMRQVEASLLDSVLEACEGNRSRAAVWLGIGRGTLRGKLAELDPDRHRDTPSR